MSGIRVGVGVTVGVAVGTRPAPLSNADNLSEIVLEATAKPILSIGRPPGVRTTLNETVPTTSPRAFINGPPLLPGLMAASV